MKALFNRMVIANAKFKAQFGKRKKITRQEFIKSLAGKGLNITEKVRLWDATKERGKNVEPAGSEKRIKNKQLLGRIKRLSNKMDALKKELKQEPEGKPETKKPKVNQEQLSHIYERADKVIEDIPDASKLLPQFKEYISSLEPDEFGDIKAIPFKKYVRKYSNNIKPDGKGNISIKTNKGEITIPQWKHDEISERSSASIFVDTEDMTVPEHTIKQTKETDKAVLLKIFFNFDKKTRMNNEFWIPKSQIKE